MTQQRLKALLVDDDEDDYILTSSLLAEMVNLELSVEWVSTYAQALDAIARDEHDVYLLDYNLGSHTGLELLHEMAARSCRAPAILLTGCNERRVDIDAMNAGAADYLVKGKLDADQLERSIRYSVRQKHAERQIARMAYYDGLTDLPNRVLFYDRLEQAVLHATRYKRRLAVLFLDIDDFKRINDTLGHASGDELLRTVASRLETCVRRSDSVARETALDASATMGRLGGDEFSLLITELCDAQDGTVLAERLLRVLHEPLTLDGRQIHISASIGIATFPESGPDAASLLKNADTAMYAAKYAGKNTYRFHDPTMNSKASDRLALEGEMRTALEHREFLLHYQPKMDIVTGEIKGLEALVRWQQPGRGLVPPADFIPLAEDTGLIVPLGAWVLSEACAQAAAWARTDGPPVTVSVNLSVRQCQPGLLRTVTDALASSGLSPRQLELEITESFLAQDAKALVEVLRQLRSLGVKLSIDDFGSGYFSFSSLKDLPVDVVKIDRSLIRDLETSAGDVAIVRAIIVMAHTLGLGVVGEGVETEGQLAILRDLDCDQMQGYLLSRPLDAASMTDFLSNRR